MEHMNLISTTEREAVQTLKVTCHTKHNLIIIMINNDRMHEM